MLQAASLRGKYLQWFFNSNGRNEPLSAVPLLSCPLAPNNRRIPLTTLLPTIFILYVSGTSIEITLTYAIDQSMDNAGLALCITTSASGEIIGRAFLQRVCPSFSEDTRFRIPSANGLVEENPI